MSHDYLFSAEDRTRAILDAYGGSPASWPAEERQQAQECIDHSPALQAYQAQLAQIDKLIKCDLSTERAHTTDVSALEQRILNQLPTKRVSPVNTEVVMLWQRLHHWLVAPRLIAALSAIILVAMILVSPHTHKPIMTAQALESYEAWSWYDITGQDLATTSKSTAMSMTDLIDLETGDDGG